MGSDEISYKRMLGLLFKGSSETRECHDRCIISRRTIRKDEMIFHKVSGKLSMARCRFQGKQERRLTSLSYEIRI